MSIKIIALDLDGTLLNGCKRLTDRNRKALEDCIRRGIHIVPCTGRIAKGIPEEIRNIPGVRYAITVNGATIEDMETGQVLGSHLLDKEIALEVMELARQYHVMYDAYLAGQGISEARFYDHLEEYGLSRGMMEMVRHTRKVVPDILDHVRQWDGQVDKVNMFFVDQEERAQVREILNRRSDVLVSSSLKSNLEINALGASKGAALMALADHLGIAHEDTMACGDGSNDLSMIRAAGLGVAMANAEEEVLAAADYVTESNEESGVAQAIEKWVLHSGL